MYSLQAELRCPQPSSTSGIVLKLIHDLAFPTARGIFVDSFPSPEKFAFCTNQIASIEWLNLVPLLSIGDCFESPVEDFVICCYHVTKVVCPKYLITSAFTARSPCYFGSQADFAISVFRKVSKNAVLL